MRVIQSVGVFSAAKIMALIQATFGLIFAPFFLLMSALGAMTGAKNAPFTGVIGLVVAIMMPIFYGVIGFIFGAIGAALYNLFAKWVGGIEVNVAAMSPVPYPLQPPGTYPAQTT
ncbi:MAG TPA: hypothetical protein VF753_13280 [Terriglobales bacterium]